MDEKLDRLFINKRRVVIILYERQSGKCKYCGVRLVDEALADRDVVIDHMISKKNNGTDDIDNLCLCCKLCNSMKGGKSAEEFQKYIQPWLNGLLPKEELSEYYRMLKLQERFKHIINKKLGV